MARMCASVKVPCSDEPRCPLVPKLTSWLGSFRSGLRSKYSRSRRATSTSISFGASLPARGEILTCPLESPAIRLRGPVLRRHVGCRRLIGQHHSLFTTDTSGGNGFVSFQQPGQHHNFLATRHQ